MALSIGVKRGNQITVGDRTLDIIEVQGLHVTVKMGGEAITVADEERTLLMPDVWLSTSRNRNNEGRTRLVFEAPRSIRIEKHEQAIL